jgi:hypothetical protein
VEEENPGSRSQSLKQRPALTLAPEELDIIKRNWDSVPLSDHKLRYFKTFLGQAAQGVSEAQFRVSQLYKDGSWAGVKENLERSFAWCYEAAVQDHLGAQRSLVGKYETGMGVDRDVEHARLWQERATTLENLERRDLYLEEKGLTGMQQSEDSLCKIGEDELATNKTGDQSPLIKESKKRISPKSVRNKKHTFSLKKKKTLSFSAKKKKNASSRKASTREEKVMSSPPRKTCLSKGIKLSPSIRVAKRVTFKELSPDRVRSSKSSEKNNYLIQFPAMGGSLFEEVCGSAKKTLRSAKESFGSLSSLYVGSESPGSTTDEGGTPLSRTPSFGSLQEKARQLWDNFSSNGSSCSPAPMTDEDSSPPSRESSLEKLQKKTRSLWSDSSSRISSHSSSASTPVLEAPQRCETPEFQDKGTAFSSPRKGKSAPKIQRSPFSPSPLKLFGSPISGVK